MLGASFLLETVVGSKLCDEKGPRNIEAADEEQEAQKKRIVISWRTTSWPVPTVFFKLHLMLSSAVPRNHPMGPFIKRQIICQGGILL
jgi:hypothetical protein